MTTHDKIHRSFYFYFMFFVIMSFLALILCYIVRPSHFNPAPLFHTDCFQSSCHCPLFVFTLETFFLTTHFKICVTDVATCLSLFGQARYLFRSGTRTYPLEEKTAAL